MEKHGSFYYHSIESKDGVYYAIPLCMDNETETLTANTHSGIKLLAKDQRLSYLRRHPEEDHYGQVEANIPEGHVQLRKV